MTSRYFYKAKINRVVDGDTVDLDIDLGFGIYYKARVRLYGLNAPEVRTLDPIEKAKGLEAKNYVYDWFAGSDFVFVKTIKDSSEKYGRMLGIIFSDEEMKFSLNDQLIDCGHATPYNP